MKLNKEEVLQTAQKELNLAEYLLHSTFPLTKDTKVLLGVLTHLYKAQERMLSALVEKGEHSQKIVLAHKDFPKVCAETDFAVLQETQELQEEHLSCPVEFTKNEKVVLCDDNYVMKLVEAGALSKYLRTTKSLLKKIQLVVGYQ